jgi:hypothetical protein
MPNHARASGRGPIRRAVVGPIVDDEDLVPRRCSAQTRDDGTDGGRLVERRNDDGR